MSQPKWTWQMPEPKEPVERRRLKVFNSFSRKKEEFVSNDRKTIRWYCCGPTVYDESHLGHARCYITFDIIRRILTNYFGYHIFYVMNITDIDDKIIKRARSGHLCAKFIEQSLEHIKEPDDRSRLLDELRDFVNNFKERRSGEQDPDKLVMIDNICKNSHEAIKEFEAALADTTLPQDTIRQILNKLRDVIADEQDAKLCHTVNDHQIFKDLTLRFEQEFFHDMAQLDVQAPSVVTRVSEFIDETGAYIKKLEQNGYAYRSGGSVYFDTTKFDSSDRHSYAKLVREAYGQRKDLEEGEGELSASRLDKKKSPNDFALWKKSKVGEPSWQAEDLEPGRPGWHIECSVMASQLLGENFDIHAGGHDLRFPHHDNEIAQAEAYYDSGKNWVNYFLHSGHLTISGCKMSKSLKNFITIRQALKEYTSRQLRFAFLAHGWAETLDYSPNTMNTALSYEKTFREFFLNTSDALRHLLQSSDQTGDSNQIGVLISNQFMKWSPQDHQVNEQYLNCVNLVDAALCDNFDTRSVLNHLSSLVKECNKRQSINSVLLKDIACYIKHILSIFGTNFSEIDLDQTTSVEAGSKGSEKDILKYVDALASFRANVKEIAMNIPSGREDSSEGAKKILRLCDSLRDQILPNLGVRLEDRPSCDGQINRPYAVKFVDSEQERLEAERKELERRMKEDARQSEASKRQQLLEEKARVPPSEMFRSQTDKYSKFDDLGLPTHDSTGKEVSKSTAKKNLRLYKEQEKRHQLYLEKSSKELSSQFEML